MQSVTLQEEYKDMHDHPKLIILASDIPNGMNDTCSYKKLITPTHLKPYTATISET